MIAPCRAFAILRVSWQKRQGGCTVRHGTLTRTPAVSVILDFGDLTAQWVWHILSPPTINFIYYNKISLCIQWNVHRVQVRFSQAPMDIFSLVE